MKIINHTFTFSAYDIFTGTIHRAFINLWIQEKAKVASHGTRSIGIFGTWDENYGLLAVMFVISWSSICRTMSFRAQDCTSVLGPFDCDTLSLSRTCSDRYLDWETITWGLLLGILTSMEIKSNLDGQVTHSFRWTRLITYFLWWV